MPNKYVPRRYKNEVFKRQNATVPLKNKKDMESVLLYFLRKRDHAKTEIKRRQADRNWMICLLGFNFAFRAEDLLQLMKIDLINGYVSLKELKTGKVQNFKINHLLFDDIKEYCERNDIKDYDYLFSGQTKKDKPLTRQQFNKVLAKARKEMKLAIPLSMHTLRKTFAYHHYLEKKDLVTLQKLLNHADASTTLLYIQWDMNDAEKAREDTYNGGVHRKKVKSRI